MTEPSEIVADYKQHIEGDIERVSWDRADGKTYHDVPVMYLREVSAETYYERHPHMRGVHANEQRFFWEVSVD